MPQVSLKDHLVAIKEDGELNVICQMIHPTIAQSLKKIGAKNYPSGGFKPNALETWGKGKSKKEHSPHKKPAARVSRPNPVSKAVPKVSKKNSNPASVSSKKSDTNVLDVIQSAKESVDWNLKRKGGPQTKLKKAVSTSSGSSNDTKAKNFYNRMNMEHQEAISKQPTSLREAWNKYKSEKTDMVK